MVRRDGRLRAPNPRRPMITTAIQSPATRIEPADRNAPRELTKNPDGSMTVTTRGGETYTTHDPDVQAFLVFVMVDPEATR